MLLEIFDVEHGACALITTSNGKRVMIDCGHNASTNWRPGSALIAAGIHWLDRLYVTNFDEDHVSGYPDLMHQVGIGALWRNPSVAPATVRLLKTKDGMGVGIERLVLCMEHVFTGGPPPIEDYGDTSFSAYWNNYSALDGFIDENNLSLVVFVTCGRHKFIFPGDMEKEGWHQLLWNPAFVAELRDVSVFVASHHGRENGYCEEVLNLCPGIEVVIISDNKKIGYQSQETVDRYRSHARGFNYNGEIRRVLTTRRDGRMFFSVPAMGAASVMLRVAA